MTTPRARALVSLGAATTVALVLGACVPGRSGPVSEGPAAMQEHPLTIRFDNDSREHVHVFLVAGQREWRLGRVEPGARAMLRIPEASLAARSEFVQLAVLTGERLTLRAARDPRARLSIAQPASRILSQRWMFAHGQLTSLGRAPRLDVARP